MDTAAGTTSNRSLWMTAALLSLPSLAALWLRLAYPPQELLSVFLFWALICLFRRALTVRNARIRVVSAMLGLLFSLFFVLGHLGRFLQQHQVSHLMVSLVGFWLLFSAALALLYQKAEKWCALDVRSCGRRTGGVRIFFLSWILLFAFYFLWLLYRFPGGVTIDSNLQILQVLGKQPLSNHHPIIHTLLIKLFFNLGLLLFHGNQNMAVATYSFFQALALSACFAFLVETLYEVGVKKSLVFAVFLCFLLLPYHGAYSITMWKDVWFGAVVLLLCICLWRMLLCIGSGKPLPGALLAGFFLSSVLMCLFRSNGLYAYLLLAPFVFFSYRRKSLSAALAPLAALLLVFLVKGPVYGAMNIIPPDTIESLSVPAQHIARSLRDGAVLSDEQEALLSQAVDPVLLAEAYVPTCSDAVKELIRRSGNQQFLAENKGSFFKLWLQMGLDNPLSYLRAQIDQTMGYWDPTVQYWVMPPDFLCSYDLDIGADCKLPTPLASAMTHLLVLIPSVPLLSLIFSIGAGVWLFLMLIGLCLLRRQYALLIVYLPVLAVWGTLLIATPVYAEFRYIYALFTSLPLLAVLPFYPSGIKAQETQNPIKESCL